MVSVIVPVYKSEKTLERCVKSLTEQDYADIEILLIVDGPPDGSGMLAEKLAATDARIRVINQKNQGVSKARNRGIKEAHGKYIRFVDSDDYVGKHSITPMVEQLEKDGSDMVIAGFQHLYFKDVVEKLPHMEGCLPIDNCLQDMERLYVDGFLNMPWNKLFRREKISGGFPTDRTLGEDLVFNMNYILTCERISVIRENVCAYIQDDRGTTLSTQKRDDKIETAIYLYEQSKDFFIKLSQGKRNDFPFLDTKVITTYLDEVETIGFADVPVMEKKQIIKAYAEAAHDFISQTKEQNIRPDKPDYKIIYFFLKRNRVDMTWLMVRLRTAVVRLVRRGR